MANNYKISLGIKLDDKELKNIKTQLNGLTDNTHRIRIDIDNSRLLKQIEHAKKELKELNSAKGNQPSLTVNTQSLEKSFGKVAKIIGEIKASLGTLDDKVNTRDIVTSVNKIANALEKATRESNGLVSSLTALSKKDFSFNLNLKAGNANPVKAMADYGDEVRDNVIPQLEERVQYFRKALGGFEKAKAELTRLMTSKYGDAGATRARNLLDSLGDDSSLNKQMNAYKRYLKYMQEIASKKNSFLLSDYNYQFPVSPEELIKDAKKIQSGTKDVEESYEKLKQVFNTGIDAQGLSTALKPIVADLRTISKFIDKLSKNNSIDGLTASFNRLSSALEPLTNNLGQIQDIVNTGFSKAAHADNAVKVAQQTGQKIGEAVGESATESAKQSINAEEEIARASTASTNTFVQNEERKQQAIKQTVNSSATLDITDDFKEARIEIKATEEQVKNLTTALRNFGFGNSAIKSVVDDISQVGFDVKKISHQLNDDGSIKITVTGFDEAKNAVAAIKSVRKVADPLDEDRLIPEIKTTTKITQSFNETEESFKRLKSLAREIGQLEFEIAGLDTDKNANEISELTRQLDKLQSEFTELYAATEGKLDKGQIATLDAEFDKTINKVSKLNAQSMDADAFKKAQEQARAEIQETKEAYERLISITKEMGEIKGELTLLDADKNASEIEKLRTKLSSLGDEYNELFSKMSTRFSDKQLTGLTQVATDASDELDIIEGQAEDAAAYKKQQAELKKVNDAFTEIYNTKKKIGSLEVDLISAKAKGDVKTVNEINDEITRLKNNISTLDANKAYSSQFTDAQKADLKELNELIEYSKKQAQNKIDYKLDLDNAKAELKKVNEAYNEIYSLKKRVGSLEVDLIKEEDTKNAQALRDEIERLKNSLNSLDVDGVYSLKFTDKQKGSLRELESQIDFAKRQAENKVDVKLGLQIDKEETREIKDAYNEIYNLKKRIGSLEVDLIGAEAKDDAQAVKDINDEITRLKNNVSTLDKGGVYSSRFTDEQKADLRELDELIKYSKRQAKNKIDYNLNLDKAKAEIKETENAFKRLISITREMGNIKIKIAGLDADENAGEIERLKTRLSELGDEYNELFAATSKNLSSGQLDELSQEAVEASNKLDMVNAKIDDLKAKLAKADINDIKLKITTGDFDEDISKIDGRLNNLSGASEKLTASVEETKAAFAEMERIIGNNDDEVIDIEKLREARDKYNQALEKTNNLLRMQERAEKADNDKIKLQDRREVFQAKIDAWLTKNSAATEKFGEKLLKLRAAAENADNVELNHLEKELIKVDKAADKAGLKMESLGDRIKSKFKEYMAYFSVAEVFMEVTQALKAMFDTVVEIDTAMTGLYRVTDLTAAQYDTLFDNMIDSAKEYGATLNDIINATTDWVRAGFDADTALGLAEVTTMYQHISDLDYDTAAENLITAYNGFKDELNGAFDGDQVAAVEYIADIFNELDNNFAVTSAGLGEALTRSASALDLAGNTIQETAG